MPKHDTKLKRPEIDFLEHSNMIETEPPSGPAFDDAAEAYLAVRDREQISEQDILNCHAILMRSRKSIPDTAKGAYTTVQTGIYSNGTCIRKNPAPAKVPGLMKTWIEKTAATVKNKKNFEADDLDGICRASHVAFENAHPFQDGNGRVGRILYNWHRLRLGLTIHVIREESAREYYAWFKKPAKKEPAAKKRTKK